MNFAKHVKTPRDMQHKYLMIINIIPSTCFISGKWERNLPSKLIDIYLKIKSDFIDYILWILKKIIKNDFYLFCVLISDLHDIHILIIHFLIKYIIILGKSHPSYYFSTIFLLLFRHRYSLSTILYSPTSFKNI